MTPGLFWSFKCLIHWGISSSWQKHKSATNQQDQSLATEVRSHKVLLCLSPCLRTMTMSLCPWKCVGCSWHGSIRLWKHWLSSWELQGHSELTWGDELCCQHGQVWMISLLLQKPWIPEPFSWAKSCEVPMFWAQWVKYFFPLFFFFNYCFPEIETTLKYQIKQVP